MIQRVAAYTLIREEGRVLLCRLSSLVVDRGKWTLPGGGIDFGEHPADAALRETFEETGFEVRLTGLVEVQSELLQDRRGQLHAIRFLYRAEIVGGTLTNEPHGSTDLAAWKTREEADRLPMVPLAARGVALAFEG